METWRGFILQKSKGREGFLCGHFFFKLGDMRELKAVHNPASPVVAKEDETPNKSKSPEDC